MTNYIWTVYELADLACFVTHCFVLHPMNMNVTHCLPQQFGALTRELLPFPAPPPPLPPNHNTVPQPSEQRAQGAHTTAPATNVQVCRPDGECRTTPLLHMFIRV